MLNVTVYYDYIFNIFNKFYNDICNYFLFNISNSIDHIFPQFKKNIFIFFWGLNHHLLTIWTIFL